MEEFIVYKVGFIYGGDLIGIEDEQITDLKTAISVLEKKRKVDAIYDYIIIQDIVKRIHLNL